MVVYAALQNGMWTEITRKDFERFSRWGHTVNVDTGSYVVMYSQYSQFSSFDVYIENELYAWCRPVDKKKHERRIFVV